MSSSCAGPAGNAMRLRSDWPSLLSIEISRVNAHGMAFCRRMLNAPASAQFHAAAAGVKRMRGAASGKKVKRRIASPVAVCSSVSARVTCSADTVTALAGCVNVISGSTSATAPDAKPTPKHSIHARALFFITPISNGYPKKRQVRSATGL